MAAKFKTAKQLYAQDKDFVLFPNIAQAHTGVAYAVTVTYKCRTYDLQKTSNVRSSENREWCSEEAVNWRVHQMLLFASTYYNIIILYQVQEQSLSRRKNASFSSI